MSGVGHCIDNGPAEGLWGIIKSEMYQMYEVCIRNDHVYTWSFPAFYFGYLICLFDKGLITSDQDMLPLLLD